jgi:uncharacterized membrane protein
MEEVERTPETSFGRVLTWGAAVVGGMLIASAWGWLTIPAGTMLPSHSDIYGRVNGWTSRDVALLAMPMLAIGVAVIGVILGKLTPGWEGAQTAAHNWKLREIVILAGLAVMGIIHVVLVMSWCGGISESTSTLAGLFLAGVLLIITGSILGKLRRNRLTGCRTPWSLASDISWSKSNRLVGWLFVVCGVLVIAVVLATRSPIAVTVVLLAGLIISGLVVSVYSYLVWRSDPNRRPPNWW